MTLHTLEKSNLRDAWKIRITTKWFGITVWSAIYSEYPPVRDSTPLEVVYDNMGNAMSKLRTLQRNNRISTEKFIEVK